MVDVKDGMFQYLEERTKALGDFDCISYYGRRIKLSEMMSRIDSLAGFLFKSGVRRGDSVAIVLPNIPNALIAFYAINKIGAIANVVHPFTPQVGLYEMLKKTKSKVIFSLDLFFEQARYAMAKMPIINIVCSAADYLTGVKKWGYSVITRKTRVRAQEGVVLFGQATSDVRICAQGNAEDTAVYIHSGGTTGKPKTVMLSNKAMNHLARNLHTVIANDGTDYVVPGHSMLMILPMFHIFGLGVCMHTTLTAGARAVLMPTFDAKQACAVIKKEKINFISGVPNMYKKMVQCKNFAGEHLQSLECCFCGGDKLRVDIKNAFDVAVARCGGDCVLSEGYGLSEATVCSVNTKAKNSLGSVGVALNGVKYGIFADDKMLEKGVYGEICISGNTIMQGYYEDLHATKDIFFTDNNGTVWLRTGDCGKMDKDGYLYFKDRIKRMVKIGGINVFPQEIEEITDSVDGVAQSCAIDIISQDSQAINLFVKLKKGFDFDKVKKAIITELSQKLMKYSIPKYITQTNEIPTTAIGKADYKKLKANIEEA